MAVDCSSINIEWSRIVGQMSIGNGGYIGDLLKLTRSHVEDAKERGEITESEAGKILAEVIPHAYKEGILFEMQNQKIEYETCLMRSKLLTEELQQDLLSEQKETADLEQELLAEKKETADLEQLLLQEKIELTEQQLLTEKEKLLAEKLKNGLQDDDVTYDYDQSISRTTVRLQDKQGALYKRQEISFDDNKLQKIFETQVNYSGLIFQDADEPDVLNMGKDINVANIYNALIRDVKSIKPIEEEFDYLYSNSERYEIDRAYIDASFTNPSTTGVNAWYPFAHNTTGETAWSQDQVVDGFTQIYSVWEYFVNDDGFRTEKAGYPIVRTKKMTQGTADPFAASPAYLAKEGTRQTDAPRYSDDT